MSPLSNPAPHQDDPSRGGPGLTIQEASDLLGVPAPTLRSWERRYGLPVTSRSPGGHRRYQAFELVQLRLLRDEIAIGRPAADAVHRVRELVDEHHPARERVDRLLAASRDMDGDAIRGVLDDTHAELGLALTLDEVVLPGMRQIGEWWATGRCDIGQETFTTEVVRGWLAKLVTLAPAPADDRWVLLAAGPRDLHTLGIEALAALLTQQRTGCRVLGQRTSLRVLATATVATSAAAVVIVSHLATQRRSAVESLTGIAATGVPTFYAGNAFVLPAARAGVPGVYLGPSIAGAARLLRTSLRTPDAG